MRWKQTPAATPLRDDHDDLRTDEVVARIWIAPFVDADGVYREASHVRVVLEPAELEAREVIGRLLELFEGPEAPGPWSPPEMPAALHELLPWRAWDESSELYVNAGSVGFVVELPPFAGVDGETLGALSGTLADAAPERCTVQVIHWASPRFGAASRAWAGAAQRCRRGAGPDGCAPAATCSRRVAGAGCIRAARPSRSRDYRVFVTACLTALPGPAAETALGAFRRALEGTLASAGAQTRQAGAGRAVVARGRADRAGYRRIPRRRRGTPAPALGAARSPARPVRRAGTRPHGPSDWAHLPPPRRSGRCGGPRVLSAIAFPEVWPGWRGNALIGDFHRDFLQPGCPVLTCLTVTTGDEAAGEKAFLKIRPRHPAGRHRHCALSARPAREGSETGRRSPSGSRTARSWCAPAYMAAVYAPLEALDEAEQAVRAIYHGQGWRVNAERYMQLPSWLACLPMVSAGGLDSDLERMGRMKTLADIQRGQSCPPSRRMAGPARQPRQPARAVPDRPARPAGLLVAPSPTRRGITTSRLPASPAPASRCSCKNSSPA